MLFDRTCESLISTHPCSTFTSTLPVRRMSTQSLICEASSLYPSVHRRHGSMYLDKVEYDTCGAQMSEARLPPPSRSTGQGGRRRRRTSSQAAHAGSGRHSSLGQYTMWPPGDLLNEVGMPSSTLNTRQRVWSETGRSCDETTIRASLRNFRNESDFLVPGSRPPSARMRSADEQSINEMENLMDLSFNDTLLRDSSGYEKLPNRKEKKRRGSRDRLQKGYHCYDNPSSLDDECNER